MSKSPYDKPSRIDLQKIVAASLLAILVIGGIAFYVNQHQQKIEHLAQLLRQMRPWCSQHHLGEPTIDSSRVSLTALAQSQPPRWEVADDSAVAFCSRTSQPAQLFVLTFSSSNSENLWLSKDDGGQYYLKGDSIPLPVFVGLGWVAVLGSHSRREDSEIASLSKLFKVDYRFSDFSSVSW